MMVDLSTTYMGLELKHPVVPSASPLSRDLATIKAMEDAGAAAVVMHSIFEEQIEFEQETLHHFLERGTELFPEAYPVEGTELATSSGKGFFTPATLTALIAPLVLFGGLFLIYSFILNNIGENFLKSVQ